MPSPGRRGWNYTLKLSLVYVSALTFSDAASPKTSNSSDDPALGQCPSARRGVACRRADEHIGGNAEPVVQPPNHRIGQAPLAVQNLGHAGVNWLQVSHCIK
jgi:hypothetical protein